MRRPVFVELKVGDQVSSTQGRVGTVEKTAVRRMGYGDTIFVEVKLNNGTIAHWRRAFVTKVTP